MGTALRRSHRSTLVFVLLVFAALPFPSRSAQADVCPNEAPRNFHVTFSGNYCGGTVPCHAGSAITFGATSDCFIQLRDTFRWVFGDGGESNEVSPTHVYASDGVYPLTLTLTNPFGSATVGVQIVIDSNAFPPSAFVLNPIVSTITVGQTVWLTAAARYPPIPSPWEVTASPAGVVSMPPVAVPAYGPASVSFPVTGVAPGVATLSYFTSSFGGAGGSAPIGKVTVVAKPPCIAPSIVQEPDDVVMIEKSESSLSVRADGTEPLTYQWEAGIEGGSIDQLPGATARHFAIPPVAPGTYHARAVAMNACGMSSSRLATVRIEPCNRPIIEQQPLSQQVKLGGYLSLSVRSVGHFPMRFVWYEGSTEDTSKPVGNSNPLIIAAVTHSASYWVHITNDCGSVDSDAALIGISSTRRRPAR